MVRSQLYLPIEKIPPMIKKILPLLLFIFSVHCAVSACSAIVLKNENALFFAKNFDWTYGDGYLIKNLRNVPKKAFYTQAGTPVSWVSKYGSVTFNQNGKEMPYGGMNEKGLAVEMLWMEYTDYGKQGEKEYLNELEWIQYQLDNYASVDEVIEQLDKRSIYPVKGKIHYILADPGGNSVVIEFMFGKVSWSKKEPNQCQAITNYTVGMSQLNYEKQGARLKGNNSSHFHRYNVLQRNIDQRVFEKTSLTVDDAFGALNDVSIDKSGFRTFWSIVYDLKQKIVYFKTENSKGIKELDIKTLDFDQDILGLDINSSVKGNIVPHLSPYRQETNTKLIQISFAEIGLEKVDAAELSAHQFFFNVTPENSFTKNYGSLEMVLKAKEGKLGNIIFAIIDSEEHARQQKAIEGGAGNFNIDAEVYTWQYYGLPKGEYIVVAIQDKIRNRQLDFDKQGNATEKYAISKQQKTSKGQLPAFKDCIIKCTDTHNEVVLLVE